MSYRERVISVATPWSCIEEQRNLIITTAFVPQHSAVKKKFAVIKNPNMYKYDK